MTYHEAGLKLQRSLGSSFGWYSGTTREIPHSTSPGYNTRLWFTPDGLYISMGRHSIANMFKAGVDYRGMSGTKLLNTVKQYIRGVI